VEMHVMVGDDGLLLRRGGRFDDAQRSNALASWRVGY
jgi:hypothetical protein